MYAVSASKGTGLEAEHALPAFDNLIAQTAGKKVLSSLKKVLDFSGNLWESVSNEAGYKPRRL